MRLTQKTPLDWRKEWKLYRSTSVLDSRGNHKRTYPGEPDFVGEAGSPFGVAWQIHSAEWAQKELGEQAQGGASFLLYAPEVAIAPFDRCVFGGYLWEVRSVVECSNFRSIGLVEVRKL